MSLLNKLVRCQRDGRVLVSSDRSALMLKHKAIKATAWIQVVVWIVRTERSSFSPFLIPVHRTGPNSTPMKQEAAKQLLQPLLIRPVLQSLPHSPLPFSGYAPGPQCVPCSEGPRTEPRIHCVAWPVLRAGR